MHHDYFGNKIHGTEESDKITQKWDDGYFRISIIAALCIDKLKRFLRYKLEISTTYHYDRSACIMESDAITAERHVNIRSW